MLALVVAPEREDDNLHANGRIQVGVRSKCGRIVGGSQLTLPHKQPLEHVGKMHDDMGDNVVAECKPLEAEKVRFKYILHKISIVVMIEEFISNNKYNNYIS